MRRGEIPKVNSKSSAERNLCAEVLLAITLLPFRPLVALALTFPLTILVPLVNVEIEGILFPNFGDWIFWIREDRVFGDGLERRDDFLLAGVEFVVAVFITTDDGMDGEDDVFRCICCFACSFKNSSWESLSKKLVSTDLVLFKQLPRMFFK